ncbi:MAG: hypothetical protein K0R94_954 [Burkholderiales bacterium]|nr:hypothetical protein [Burkholderiales bacterium]
MRKLLLSLMALPVICMASSVDMSTLACGQGTNEYKITKETTLEVVQKKCHLKKQWHEDGLYWVKFINSATDKKVKCSFGSNTPSAIVSGCI